MCVSFRGESAGSLAFRGGESSGSIGIISSKQNPPIGCYTTDIFPTELVKDVVDFKGSKRKENANSACKTIANLVITTGILIGGLAYAHKAGWITKMSDGKFKDILTKASKTSYEWCTKSKDTIVNTYNKVKNYFTKKS